MYTAYASGLLRLSKRVRFASLGRLTEQVQFSPFTTMRSAAIVAHPPSVRQGR